MKYFVFIISLVLVTIACFLISYGCCAYYEATFDIVSWDKEVRFVCIFVGFLMAMGAGSIVFAESKF